MNSSALKVCASVAFVASFCNLLYISGAHSAQDGGDGRTAMSGPSISGTDKNFLVTAAIDGMTEIAAGRLAVAQGSSDEVRAFGQHMIDDHTKVSLALETLAEKEHQTLPVKVDERHQALLDSLRSRQGHKFDTAFVADMMSGHEEIIETFRRAQSSTNGDIADFATATLPILKDHQINVPTIMTMKSEPLTTDDGTARR